MTCSLVRIMALRRVGFLLLKADLLQPGIRAVAWRDLGSLRGTQSPHVTTSVR